VSHISRASLFGKLNSLAYKSVERATDLCKRRGNPYVDLEHWIHQILTLDDSDLHRIVRRFGPDTTRMQGDFTAALDKLPRGASAISDLSDDLQDSVERAWAYATLQFDLAHIRTGVLLAAILATPRTRKHLLSISGEFERVSFDVLSDDFWEITEGSPEDGLSAHDGTKLRFASAAARDIFVCYRRNDSAHPTDRIFASLCKAFGKHRVFRDVDSIPPAAQDFAAEIKQQLQGAKAMLVVIGSRWLDASDGAESSRLDDPDDYVRTEIQFALDRGIAIIPILVDDVQIPAARMLPEVVKPLATRQASKVRADPDFDSDVDRLLETVNTIVGGRRNLLLSRDP
jgi:TIR domain